MPYKFYTAILKEEQATQIRYEQTWLYQPDLQKIKQEWIKNLAFIEIDS